MEEIRSQTDKAAREEFLAEWHRLGPERDAVAADLDERWPWYMAEWNRLDPGEQDAISHLVR